MQISKLVSDFRGLFLIMPFWQFLKYSFLFVKSIPTIIKERNLSSVDMAFGNKVKIQFGKDQYFFSSDQAIIGGIREIWVRKVYSGNSFLEINRQNPTIFDLGANIGMFSSLAKAVNPTAKVYAIEPNHRLNELYRQNFTKNFNGHDFTVFSSFIGGTTSKQKEMKKNAEDYDSNHITLDAILSEHNITEIDFLKCDIEGAEFELFRQIKGLFPIINKIAVEVHDFAGDRYGFRQMLVDGGFQIEKEIHNPHDCILLASRAVHSE
jgi:FkbM family methyltransferase